MDIFVYDDLHPEDVAMLQALYSRSPASVVKHIDKVKGADRGKFMEKFYIGYGHASIGDCGTFTLFIEQVSQLAAKAVQNNSLYNGQEASTRYLDFSEQEVIDPYKSEYTDSIQKDWIKIYFRTLNKLIESVKKVYPFNADEYKSEKIWENTIKAKCFDISRSLLPCGTTTLLSWSTNLRQARDNLMRLKNHPSEEIRDMAKNIFKEVYNKYPSSFNGREMDQADEYYQPRDDFYKKYSKECHYIKDEDLIDRFNISEEEIEGLNNSADVLARTEAIDLESLNKNEGEFLSERPKGAGLPIHLDSYGNYNLMFMLDFGSFRDIQRHRHGVCQIPLVTAKYGLNKWYLGEFEKYLSKEDYQELLNDIQSQFDKVANISTKGIETNEVADQYYLPMGCNCLCHLSYGLPQMVYVSELRSGKTVHPSLRPIAHSMVKLLNKDIPNLPLYADLSANKMDAKRGVQTISEKKAS